MNSENHELDYDSNRVFFPLRYRKKYHNIFFTHDSS